MEKDQIRLREPGSPEAAPACDEVRRALTDTVSPGLNGLVGTNAVPAWSGSATSRPECRPLAEPVTTGLPAKSERRSAEKMICDCTEASGVLGKGITCRAG